MPAFFPTGHKLLQCVIPHTCKTKVLWIPHYDYNTAGGSEWTVSSCHRQTDSLVAEMLWTKPESTSYFSKCRWLAQAQDGIWVILTAPGTTTKHEIKFKWRYDYSTNVFFKETTKRSMKNYQNILFCGLFFSSFFCTTEIGFYQLAWDGIHICVYVWLHALLCCLLIGINSLLITYIELQAQH